MDCLNLSYRNGTLAEALPSMNDQTRRYWEACKQPVPFDLPTDKYSTDGRWRVFYDFLTLYTDRGRRGVVMAAVGPAEAYVTFNCFVESGSAALEIISRMDDVLVDPGQSRRSEEVLILAGPYTAAAETVMRWIAATHGHRTHRGAITGWCSWYLKGAGVTDGMVNSLSNVVADSGKLPMDIIQIDDGFQKTAGDWSCNERFAGGMAPVLEKIHNAGAVPGIWLAPLVVHDSLGWTTSRPDWFQRTREGKLALEAGNWGPVSHYLDPTHPGVKQFMRQAVADMREQGFRYFKFDFNGLHDTTRFHDPRKTSLQAFREMYGVFRNAAGEDSYILACTGGLNRGAVGFVDAARIGVDSCPKLGPGDDALAADRHPLRRHDRRRQRRALGQ